MNLPESAGIPGSRALSVLGTLFLFELALADDGPPDCPAADYLGAIVGADLKRVEAAIERFQFRLRPHYGSDFGCGAMIDVDGRADADLITLAKRKQRIEGRPL